MRMIERSAWCSCDSCGSKAWAYPGDTCRVCLRGMLRLSADRPWWGGVTAPALDREQTFDEPVECSECGHLHFYPTPKLYWPCPVYECGCDRDDSELLDLMGVGAPVTVHAIDRDRLLRDLRAAAATADVSAHGDPPVAWVKLHGMARAWRVLAAASEDGEYDDEGRHGAAHFPSGHLY